ncbi:hypothetical protein [Methylomagnum sp.]
MHDKTTLKLGALAATYLLWLTVWLVLGPAAFGSAYYNWDESSVTGLSATLAFLVARRVGEPHAGFLRLTGLGLVTLCASWIMYDPPGIHPGFHFSGEGTPSYSSVSYALFVFAWICAWGYRVIDQWRRRPPSVLTGAVFAILMFGLALILANYYYPEYGSNILDTVAGRLDAVAAGLEFITLVVGLASILLGESAVLTWMLFATVLQVASDMAYAEAEVPAVIEPFWMLGEFLMLAALVALPGAAARFAPQPEPGPAPGKAPGADRSGLSGILIMLSLGGALLLVAVWLTPIHSVWKSFFSVLFIVALVVILVWITERFDETVKYLQVHTENLYCGRFAPCDWREAEPRIRATLLSTGLGAYLDALREAATRLRRDVLFLGPERLYLPPKASGGQGRVRCFIVMPFSLEWSNDVHRILSRVCEAAGVQPVRGDDLFTPTDILNDIWQSINGADFVITDISGRNPNVFYELGIAHTLAKPVLLISRSAADIPIDLSTRRVILYGQSELDWRDDLDRKVSKAVREILDAYGLAAVEGTATGARQFSGEDAPEPGLKEFPALPLVPETVSP